MIGPILSLVEILGIPMLQKLFSFESKISNLALQMSMMLICLAVCLAFYQVLTRFIFNTPSAWSEVGTRFSMVWCVFLAVAATFGRGYMMALDVVLELFPKKTHVLFEALSISCGVIMLFVLAYYGYDLTIRSKLQQIAGLGISMAWLYLAIPVGSALAIFSLCVRMISIFNQGKCNSP